jgi:hypothetical protein
LGGRGDGKRKSKDKMEKAEENRLMEWIEENGWEVSNGTKQGDEEGEWIYIGSRGETLRNSERKSMGKSRRIQNRRGNRVGPSRNSFEEAKGRERTEKERDWDRNKTIYFNFLKLLLSVKVKCNQESESP